MKSKLIMVLVCLVATVYQSFSQEYKFGKVSKEELQEASYPGDSTANAAVLYENKKVYYQYGSSGRFQLITEVHKRVKLYNKNGFDFASEEVFLYKGNRSQEKLTGLKAKTYTLIDDNIVVSDLQKDGIFKSEFSETYNQVKFTLPTLAEGSVIEFKYKIISPFLINIDRVYLQRKIPIKKLIAEIQMPEFFNFKKFTTGYLPINLKKSSASQKDYLINVDKVNSYNIPAFKKEPFSGNSQNYISSIVYELSSIDFPGGGYRNFSTSWEDVVNNIFQSNQFGEELKKRNYYIEDLGEILEGISDPNEKINSVYEYVKNKVKWNERNSVFTRKGVKSAYKEGVGNSAEINLMLMSMLSEAGFNVNPVILGTSDKVISLFPTMSGFNYVIARVKLPNGEIIYLDATDEYGAINILPERVVKGTARVIAKNGTSQYLDLRPKKPSLNRYNVQYEVGADGTVNGKRNVRHLGYLAHDFRVKKAAMDDESKVKILKEKYALNEIEDYTTKGIKEFGKGVNERFTFASEDQVEVIENEMFFAPLLFLRDQENIFKSDEREYPVDFGFGFSNMYTININIPEGYEVVECPKPGAFKLPDNLGSFKFRSMVSNGTIQISVNETINASIIPANYYAALKEFYNKVIQKEEEQIVLKKV